MSVRERGWLGLTRGIDAVKSACKGSRLLRRMPLLRYTYWLEWPRTIVVDELRLIYLPIPKVASRSIKVALAHRIGLSFDGHPDRAAWRTLPLPLAVRRTDYYRFGFVRDPLDRLASCYAQKIVLYGRLMKLPSEFWRYGDWFRPDMSFDEFVRRVAVIPDHIADMHFRSQHRFLCHRGRSATDFVGRFERLITDWRTLQERFDLPDLSHENPSPRGRSPALYSKPLAVLAAERYREDVERFGYRFAR